MQLFVKYNLFLIVFSLVSISTLAQREDAPTVEVDSMLQTGLVQVDLRQKSLEVMKYEVTNALWSEVMGEPLGSACARCPKTSVSASEINAFIAKLNVNVEEPFRMMDFLEFTYLLWHHKEVDWQSRSTCSELNPIAWFRSNSGRVTHPVGEKAPNSLGIYDLAGNAAEWVKSTQKPPANATASERENIPTHLSAGRSSMDPCRQFNSAGRVIDADTRDPFIGFRLVRDVK